MSKAKATGDLSARLKKNSRLSHGAADLNDSIYFGDKTFVPTSVPMLNVALSGRLNGGLTSGVTVLAGESKSFKTLFGLLMAAAYMKKYPDAIMMFYDSEFGSPPDYLKQVGVPLDRVIHNPIANIEEFKFDIVNQLENINRGEHVIIFVDSIGNLASKKELEDAKDEKSTADMTRAKQLKSVFRMVTPYMTLLDIPMVVVNHTYKEQGLFPKNIVSGGTGIYYSSDTIWIITKSQVKKGTELEGFNFNINIEKSRFVREKSKIPITVKYGTGMDRFTGLLDIAIELGYVVKPKNGWYSRVIPDTETGEVKEDKNWRRDDTSCIEFWGSLLKETDFPKAVERKFSLGEGDRIIEGEEDELQEFITG